MTADFQNSSTVRLGTELVKQRSLNDITQKLLNRISPNFGGNLAHGPRKIPLDFDGNPDYVTPRSGWV